VQEMHPCDWLFVKTSLLHARLMIFNSQSQGLYFSLWTRSRIKTGTSATCGMKKGNSEKNLHSKLFARNLMCDID
jgi:hypothetical protein